MRKILVFAILLAIFAVLGTTVSAQDDVGAETDEACAPNALVQVVINDNEPVEVCLMHFRDDGFYSTTYTYEESTLVVDVRYVHHFLGRGTDLSSAHISPGYITLLAPNMGVWYQWYAPGWSVEMWWQQSGDFDRDLVLIRIFSDGDSTSVHYDWETIAEGNRQVALAINGISVTVTRIHHQQ